MQMYDILQKKKEGKALTAQEIDFFVQGFTRGDIPDYQASALMMAICLNKMNEEETIALTRSMMHSGELLDLKNIKGITVDKHSTGGVGDKTTLVLAPLLASVGLKVAKMSGRALGHTGGTIDKLESFDGFCTEIDTQTFETLVNQNGLCVMAQTKNLAPADKKLYALRDVTATVDNLSLIASSIMSKKLAAGAKNIVLDVKCGSGSFMKTQEEAKELARLMVKIGNDMGRSMSAVLSNMDEPLGYCIGNALEVKEAIETLQGRGAKDLRELCITLATLLLQSTGIETNEEKAQKILTQALDSGKAYDKFVTFITAQGADKRQIQNPSLLAKAAMQKDVLCPKDGYIESMVCNEIGMASLALGAGRETIDSQIDYGAGIVLQKKTADPVKKGDVLATIFAADEHHLNQGETRLLQAYRFCKEAPKKTALILDIIR